MSSQNQTWRFFAKTECFLQQEILLDEEEHHYAFHVLRLAAGASVELGDCAGTLARGVISRCDKKAVLVSLEPPRTVARPASGVHVYLGMPKPSTLEEVVSLCSELGVASLTLIRTQRSQIKAEPKMEKLSRISKEALRINKNSWATQICYFESVDAFLRQSSGMIFPSAFCDESPLYDSEVAGTTSQLGHLHLLPWLESKAAGALQHGVGVIIGPEASFTAEERQVFIQGVGAQSVALGSCILRVPTAVGAAASVCLAYLAARADTQI